MVALIKSHSLYTSKVMHTCMCMWTNHTIVYRKQDHVMLVIRANEMVGVRADFYMFCFFSVNSLSCPSIVLCHLWYKLYWYLAVLNIVSHTAFCHINVLNESPLYCLCNKACHVIYYLFYYNNVYTFQSWLTNLIKSIEDISNWAGNMCSFSINFKYLKNQYKCSM